MSLKGISNFAAACLLLFALCGCGKSDSQKPLADPHTLGCASNLRGIDAAKSTWAQQHSADSSVTPTADDLDPYFRHGFPKCPDGGTYTIGKVSELPQCSIPAHNDYFKASMAPEPAPAPAP